ncbi:MAG: ribosome biogenesis GTP-binding protein YihA/YsxC [Amoebophilaceae bacterium]|jgi:GTP-binding protein|nr:ribosome biogenesis GTP-binding protein YihA/YsxC [Amoebophilaceae bacterium]
MQIKTAVFSGSSAAYAQCPQTPEPELALVGRSNVGKSSLINMLLDRKHIAKISRKPGKTQLINHFLVNDAWCLVDLPGYGWAQVGSTKRHQWKKMVRAYLLHRKQLGLVLVLVDARHPPQKLDLAFIDWLRTRHIPFVVLLTKADKSAKHQVEKKLTALQSALSDIGAVLPRIFVTSSRDKTGREELLCYIQHTLFKHSG